MQTTRTIRLLMIEDNPIDVEIVRTMLAQYGRVKFELESLSSTDAALAKLMGSRFDLVLLDYNLPGEDGLAFLQRLARSGGMPPVIMLTGDGDERLAAEAMQAGAYDYFPKRAINSVVLARAIHQALEKYDLDQQLESTERVIFSLAAAVDAKGAVTGEHLTRLAYYSNLLGQTLGLSDHELRLLQYGAMLHDIGKVGISEALLRKPGPLNEYEWAEMRQHPVVGERICGELRFARDVCPIIRHHHERWDGGGYTDGLSGEMIPLLARIIGIVDAYDAMTSHRPYRMALPEEEAMSRLIQGAGTQWDPYMVESFVQFLRTSGTLREQRALSVVQMP
jgi:putative two-component system response regulator